MSNATKTAASPKKKGGAAVARSEVKKDDEGKPVAKTVEFHGLKLEGLPAEIPPVLMMSAHRAMTDGDHEGDVMAQFKFLERLMGAEYWRAEQLIADLPADEQADAIQDMVKAVLGAYGLGPGE